MANAGGLCAVSTDSGASMLTTNQYYNWNGLATAPCALLSAGNTYCYNVGDYGYLVVGHGLSVASGGNRKLLQIHKNESIDWDDESTGNPTMSKRSLADRVADFHHGWSHTAEPCASLASKSNVSGVILGVLDVLALEHCLHWRYYPNFSLNLPCFFDVFALFFYC